MGWQILDCTSLHGEICFLRNKRKLSITSFDTGEIVECSPIDVNVMFVGIGVSIGAGVISHLTANDVVVLFCDWKGVPISGMYPWINPHGRITARQRAQASLSTPRSKNAWMRIVKAKILGQAANLDALGRLGGDKLREIAAHTKSGDPSNCEAVAARYYWPRLFADRRFLRTPGERFDNRNSMLDYAYTILRGHSMRAVLSAGLTPALGICHCGHGNSFALADDLIEPFRPAIDYVVASMNQGDNFEDKEVRKKLALSTTQQFLVSGETIPSAMVDFAQAYGMYVEGNAKYLSVPVWSF